MTAIPASWVASESDGEPAGRPYRGCIALAREGGQLSADVGNVFTLGCRLRRPWPPVAAPYPLWVPVGAWHPLLQPEFRAGSLDRVASWIKDVTALPNGDFRLTYIADDGWLMDPTEKHFVMEQRIQDGVLIASKMAKPLFDKVR